jgi:cyclase
MLKIRIIPILTFNGFGLVKTKKFNHPRMVGNPIQSARVYNSRGVDELVFLDIYATKQNRKPNLKIIKDVIKECFMPVAIGGAIDTIEDINHLLKAGADKVVIKSAAIKNPDFIKEASNFFGSQCICISVDVVLDGDNYMIYDQKTTSIHAKDFINQMENLGAGEILLTSVDNDGEMKGFDLELYNSMEKITNLPIVLIGGGGNLDHYSELFSLTNCDSVGSSSIFHFTQFTPLDIKLKLAEIGKPVRL